jgi:hypothetical protein
VKLADIEPAATETAAGTANAPVLLDSVTVAAVTAGWFKETVQLELLPLPKDVGVQDTLLTTVGTTETLVTVPPLPLTVMADPSADAPNVLLTDMAVLEMPGATVTSTVAITPFDIRLVFRPARMQL